MGAGAIPTFDEFKKQQDIPAFDDYTPPSWSEAKKTPTQPRVGGQKVLDYATDTLSNIPSSTVNLAKNIGTAVAHPVDTAESLGKVAVGAAQNMTPGYVTPERPGYSKEANSAWDAMKDRYGSPEAFAETLRTDPVGVASDVSAVVGGASGLARGAGAVSKAVNLPRVASAMGKVADTASAVSDATNPLMLAGKAISKVPVPEKLTPAGMYASAIKIRPALKGGVDQRDKIIATGIREGIPVSRSGFDETGKRVEGLLAEDAAKIKASAAPDINPLDVTKPLNRLKPTFGTQVNPDADLSAINKVKREFLAKHTTEAPYTKIAPGVDEPGFVPIGQGVTRTKQPISVADSQAEKTGTYRQLRGKYNELSSADIEAQKQLARGLREEIAKRVPGLNGARESELIALEEQLSRFVGREGNKNFVGLIPAIIGSVGGAALGHGIEGGAAGLMGTLAVLAMDNPAIKSRIAIALDRTKRLKGAATVGARGLNAAGVAGEGANAIPHYAKGGIIKSPTLLVNMKTNKPSGIMAEKGPEAIIPLPKAKFNLRKQFKGIFAGSTEAPPPYRIRGAS